jgi:hypothetical protein
MLASGSAVPEIVGVESPVILPLAGEVVASGVTVSTAVATPSA